MTMYPRVEYEMAQADLDKILDACGPVIMMKIGSYVPRSPQENANDAWAELGRRMGFESMTVQPVAGKEQRFFTAVPSETPGQRAGRLEREAEARKAQEVAKLKAEIEQRSARLAELETP